MSTTAPKSRAIASAKRRGDPAFPEFQLADSPLYLIVRTAGRYSIDMQNALNAISMDVPSWRALMVVHESNPSSVSEIAEQSAMRLSTMTRVVQRLEKQGFVTLARRESDARVTEVFITPAGREMVKETRRVASNIYKMALNNFTDAEITTLNQLTRRVFSNLTSGETDAPQS